MNLEKARKFVLSQGSEVEKARFQYIVANGTPSQDVIDRLFQGQRVDGGWVPFWAGEYTSLDATCFKLAQAEQLGLAASPAVVRAVDYIARRQAADGSWEEAEEVADLAPPWAMPGNLHARLYLTANCGFWLAYSRIEGGHRLKAAGYLSMHLDEHGELPGFLHTHWLAGGLWHIIGWQEPAEQVFEFLRKNIDRMTASNLAWLVTTLSASGVPASLPLIVKAVLLLEKFQQEDGRWQSEDGASQDVHVTLEALRALHFCGKF